MSVKIGVFLIASVYFVVAALSTLVLSLTGELFITLHC